MENISLESLDLKVHRERPEIVATMKESEKRRYRNKMLFVWGIPIACGIFSFLYWFLFIPLLWSALPHQQWPMLWFSVYGVIAFAVWLAIIAACLLFWRHKRNTIVKSPQKYIDRSRPTDSRESINDSKLKTPTFPTQPSVVQPITDTPPLYRDYAGSSVCIQVQPQNTPSLYNARTGRESYETGYHLDNSEPTSSSVSVQSVIAKPQDPDKQNSGVLLLKKMDSIKSDMGQRKRISSSGSEVSSIDIKSVPRHRGDGVDSSDSENEGTKLVTEEELNEIINFKTEASIERTPHPSDEGVESPAPFTREESFRGLPEMNSFGEYLQLVTIETPMSPREVFFSDLMLNKNEEAEVKMRGAGDRRSYCVGDLSAAQQRIKEARKSMPLFMYARDEKDIESGPITGESHPADDIPAVLEIVDESPKHSPTLKLEHIYTVLKPDEPSNISEEPISPVKTSSVTTQAKVSSSSSKDNGKYFIANVLRTESITSEVHLNVEGDNTSPKGYKLTKWETKTNGSLSEVPIEEESSAVPQGRWVVLSKDYAANNLEAFIRIEAEAMAKERAEGKFRGDEDADNDSVFLELDQC